MNRTELTLDHCRDAIHVLEQDDREIWILAGMALKAEFGESAFKLWDSWSSESSKYKTKEAKTVWKSFKGGKIGIGTFIKACQDSGYVFPREELTDEECAQRKREAAERKKAAEARRKQEEEEDRAWRERIADICTKIEHNLLTDEGDSPYLAAKGVSGHGVRYAKVPFIVEVDMEANTAKLVTNAINDYFRTATPRIEAGEISVRYVKPDTLVLPLRDVTGKLWGMQFIFPNSSKKFIKHSRKSGTFFMIGEVNPDRPMAIVEGYATGASIYEAFDKQWAVAVALDAGNLQPVAQSLRQQYPDQQFIIPGDDDRETQGNPGRTKAIATAKQIGGVAVFPEFEEEKTECRE